jgi:tetratricopeptide (TPR) repeat protein
MNRTAVGASARSHRYWRMLQSSWRHPLSATLLIVLIGLIGFAFYFAGWQFWAEYHYRAALRALEQSVSTQTREHLNQARAHLVLCLQVRPNSLDTNLLAARASRRLLAYDDAEQYLRQYKKLDGVPEALDLEHTLIQVQRGDLSKETEAFLWYCVKNEHQDKILILEALAREYLQTYQLQSVLECLNQWLELQPNALQALLWRAQVERVVSRFNMAIDDYEEALKLDPDCDEARLNLAEILVYVHKPMEAAVHFDYLADRQPGNVAVVLGQARCKEELGEIEESRKLFDRLVRVKPDDPQVLAESGKLLLNTGQLTEAEARLREALRLAPYEREALFSMYKCLEQQGKKAEAKKYLDESNRVEKELDEIKTITLQIMQMQFRKDAALRCKAARILMRNGQEKEGKRWLDDALRVDPQFAETYLLLADYFERAGQPDKASLYRRRAAELGAPGLNGK